ncbi:hypothetical protein ACFOQM_12610 [Paenibacillus sp. GCM10012307]|uniref:Uncharacterized protein n=1 Tax=Paenibacillus roseus TaxID=2798579 RepID=A0A934J5L4_9BACL|nr:hypothetical protein [Paenibacillus roseus]MBJ6362134.1 hypothetical protein [Paenibacillus roseus]
MNREELARQARVAGAAAMHNLRWMNRYPERINQAKKADMIAYLNMLIAFSRQESRNTRRPGRVSLGTHLKNILLSIAQNSTTAKEGRQNG